MSTYTGNEGTVKLDSDAIGELRNWSLSESEETHDTTVIGSTATTRKPMGFSSWSGSTEVFLDLDDTGQSQLSVGEELTFNFYMEGETTGNNYKTGSAIITAIESQAAHDGMLTASISFEGNGALTPATVS